MNYEKINWLFRNSDFAKMDFYEKIGLSATGYRQMMENKTIRVETLEKIASFFDKPVGFFFDVNDVSADINPATDPATLRLKVDELYEENRLLSKELSKLKDEIRVLEKNSAIPGDTPIPKLNR